MCLQALLIHDLLLREAALPNFAYESELMRKPMREPPLDELHGLFDRHVAGHLNQEVNVIRHDNEIKQLEFALRDKRTQHIDEKLRIALRL